MERSDAVLWGSILAGFAGLQELVVTSTCLPPNRVEEFFRIVGPTMLKLSLDGDFDSFAPHLHYFTILTHLNLESQDDDPTPALLALPRTISSLAVSSDALLLPVLQRLPTTLPSTLRHLRLYSISSPATFEYLPPLERLITWEDDSDVVEKYLKAAAPGDAPFKNICIHYNAFDSVAYLIEAQCKRLGIGYMDHGWSGEESPYEKIEFMDRSVDTLRTRYYC